MSPLSQQVVEETYVPEAQMWVRRHAPTPPPQKLTRYGAHFYLEFTVGSKESAAEEAEIIAKYHGGDSYVNIETLLPTEEPDVSSGHTL